MEIINITEEMVRNRILQLLKKDDVCTCDRCLNDIYALTLNNLPPRYVSTPSGELYKKVFSISNQQEVDMDIAIRKAIDIVKKAPNHN